MVDIVNTLNEFSGFMAQASFLNHPPMNSIPTVIEHGHERKSKNEGHGLTVLHNPNGNHSIESVVE
jgi:hypothetical protein